MIRYISFASIILAYYFLDAPLVHWIHNQRINKIAFFNILTHIPDAIIAFLILFFLVFILFFKRFEKVKLFNVLFIAMASVAVSAHIKDFLKFIFARYWPNTWIDNNPSLLVDNVYGFQFFEKGTAYQSFPSGHTTVTFAFFSVLIYFYPKYKTVFLIPCILLGIGQVLMHYHFLSDVIAGGLLGWMVAIIFCRFIENKIKLLET
ncbi:phosphatase PAP2 family protein [Pigmentibacter sp. JX0631]|uniref:phosphatase PAP2 family protein n=1 Tax=Pigmentibacter sp. JX0631 TaxID=2976982 RepID=UPI002468C987|nr:phosphatase PAP2 family protein [Pigmentibacter sp. JX0631]WGL59483.1 phosphatase PAP2 family protein [Pigmentibacter sp. JX0631]